MKEHPEDKQIISEILRGGPQAERAFEHLVLKYGRSLYHQIFTVLRNDAQSKDVLQNVFIKVWTGLSSFREESGLYTWLYRITRNETLNHLQKEKVRSTLSLDGPVIHIVPGHSALEGKDPDEITDLLNEAIDQLPEKQALVFRLKYFEELKYSEIAERTGTSEGALKASFHIASQKIEEFLRLRLNF
jgi:RNA polymerase sigma-70 factor (ECF subfamily)